LLQDTLEFREFLTLVLPSISSLSFIEATQRAVTKGVQTERGCAKIQVKTAVARMDTAGKVVTSAACGSSNQVTPLP
jgi:hypothetical protein